MESDHQRFRFSATFRTDDPAVLHCLRALNHWANHGEGQPMIGWGGTTEDDWRRQNGESTVRFTSEARRRQWEGKANQLFGGRWSLLRTNDNDPATPQARTRRFSR